MKIISIVADSTGGTGYDTITDFDFAHDKLDLDTAVDVSAPDTASGDLSLAGFDSELHSEVNGSVLSAFGAVLFHVSSGDLVGRDFLIVDQDGNAGYTNGADVVIDVTGYSGGPA